MKSVRERFEEIWPVPEGVFWRDDESCYWPHPWNDETYAFADEWDKRLDTFTRCQETSDIYVSLISQLVYELEDCYQIIAADRGGCFTAECFDRAKQIMEQKK